MKKENGHLMENGFQGKREKFEEKDKLENEDEEVECFTPPDGGFRAWLILVGSFLCNGILFGVINSYSVIQDKLYLDLKENNVTEASSKAALVGSLAMGSTFLLSAVSGILTDLIGVRPTCFIGGAVATSGLLISSFYTHNINALYFTYGIMYGIGCALAYTPSLAILGHYFKRYMGIVNGVVTTGSSIFTMAMPHIIGYFLDVSLLSGTLQILAVICSLVMICSLSFKPLIKSKKRVELMSNGSVFKNKKYLSWAIIIAISLCGYFVPYVHMSTFVKENFDENADGKLPIIFIGMSSGLGRLIFGYIADRKGVSRIFLQQISFIIIGTSSILLPFTKNHFNLLLTLTFIMGIFDGCFVALLGPIAFDICGHNGATQAIGFLLALSSIPLTIGPYVAGILYDHLGNYELALRLAGIPPIIGGIVMFIVGKFQSREENLDEEISGKDYLDVNSKNARLNESIGEDEKIC
ncbi:monocarboxylate transporter 10 isoform X2 [Onthophagus taurus]|uniref:monocarboxylate transporter 10 isoform X2 n=1 Tax=Onthophagus taurus TaxID=166361 RepID=UPI000C20CD4F|nr:monocarboxylate transporter 10 isoform X2 [Onthophagus taurus]